MTTHCGSHLPHKFNTHTHTRMFVVMLECHGKSICDSKMGELSRRKANAAKGQMIRTLAQLLEVFRRRQLLDQEIGCVAEVEHFYDWMPEVAKPAHETSLMKYTDLGGAEKDSYAWKWPCCGTRQGQYINKGVITGAKLVNLQLPGVAPTDDRFGCELPPPCPGARF